PRGRRGGRPADEVLPRRRRRATSSGRADVVATADDRAGGTSHPGERVPGRPSRPLIVAAASWGVAPHRGGGAGETAGERQPRRSERRQADARPASLPSWHGWGPLPGAGQTPRGRAAGVGAVLGGDRRPASRLRRPGTMTQQKEAGGPIA